MAQRRLFPLALQISCTLSKAVWIGNLCCPIMPVVGCNESKLRHCGHYACQAIILRRCLFSINLRLKLRSTKCSSSNLNRYAGNAHDPPVYHDHDQQNHQIDKNVALKIVQYQMEKHPADLILQIQNPHRDGS